MKLKSKDIKKIVRESIKDTFNVINEDKYHLGAFPYGGGGVSRNDRLEVGEKVKISAPRPGGGYGAHNMVGTIIEYNGKTPESDIPSYDVKLANGEILYAVKPSNIKRLSENKIYQMVKESVQRVLTEDIDDNALSDLDEDIINILEDEGYSPYDFELQRDEDVAEFHMSNDGYVVTFDGNDFGEIWKERNGDYVGNAESPLSGELFTYSGATPSYALVDMLEHLADEFENGYTIDYNPFSDPYSDDRF